MRLLWIYLLAFLILPIIGEYIVLITNEDLDVGNVSFELIMHNILFVIILLLTAFFFQNYRATHGKIIAMFNNTYAKNIFRRAIILLIFISIFIFTIGGYKIVFGLADRGELRTTLGFFGPLYTVALSYLPVAIFVFVSVVYIHLSKKNQKLYRKKLIFIFLFALLLGYISGYKAVALTLMIPGLTVLYFDKFNVIKVVLFIIFAVILLTVFTAIVREMPITDAFIFMLHRATVMTAYGTIGVWNHFSGGVSAGDIFINFMGVFGEKISSTILNIPANDPEFLKTNLSRLITYEMYPDTERALANSVNVTVSNFGHALYLLGKPLYIYYAFIMGMIIGLIIRIYKKFIIKGYALEASMIAVYFFCVIIPSINSGGIFILISLPVFIYLLLSYLIVRYLLRGNIRVI